MKSLKRIALVVVLGAAVVLSAFAPAPKNPSYNEKAPWTFEPPTQNTNAFSGKYLNITNGDLNGLTFSNGLQENIAGWNQTINKTTTLGGAVDLGAFPTFKNTYTKKDLSHFESAPRSNAKNGRAFILANNFHPNTSSRATLTSDIVELESDGYFIASVDFYAVGGFGAFGLKTEEAFPLDEDSVPEIILPQYEYAPNKSEWQTAQLFIKTDLLQSQKFSLVLGLGNTLEQSRGVIYFQNPRIWQTTAETYVTELTKAQTYNETLCEQIDLNNQETNIRGAIDPTDLIFENAKSNYMVGTYGAAQFHTNDIPYVLNFRDRAFVHGKNNGDGADVGFMMSSGKYATSMKTKESFLVRRHQIYMINFYALGQNASWRIRDASFPKEEDMETTTIITDDLFTSDFKAVEFSGRETKNNWTLNTIFITGGTYKDVALDFELWIGDENSGTKGYLLFDDFAISRVSENYFNRNSTSTQNLTLPSAGTTAPQLNAHFELGSPKSVDNPYPLVPQAWTIGNAKIGDKDNDLVKSGIVNTESAHWDKYNADYSTVSKPIGIRGESEINNVMLMQNLGNTWQVLQSESISLTIASTNTIYFDMVRQYDEALGFNFWVTVESTNNNRLFAKLDLGYTGTGKNYVVTPWERHFIKIKESNLTNHEVVVKFYMGSAEKLCPMSAVLIDNFGMTDQTIPANGIGTEADLTDVRKFWANTADSTAYMDNDILVLQTNDTTKAVKTSGRMTERLTENEFYELHVKTFIGAGTPRHICKDIIKDGEIETCTEEHETGINMRLEGFEGGFLNLTSETIGTMNVIDEEGYADLVFYVRPDSAGMLSLEVQFGNEYVTYDAPVFIKSITPKKIDEPAFISAQKTHDKVENDGTRFRSNYTFITQSWQPPVEETPETSNVKAPFQWYIIIPSLIMGIALLIAIFGFFIRKFRFRLHIDKHHTSYAADDRSARVK